MALDPNIQRWVDALRSGTYQQTTGRLHTDAGFCCLGVCRDILGTEWGDAGEVLDGSRVYESDTGEKVELDDWALPDALGEFLSSHYGPDDDDTDYQNHLAILNDEGASFSEIADWIEAKAAL